MLPKDKSDHNWREYSNCDSTISDFFFVNEETGQYSERKRIQIICDSCPVKAQCYEWALNRNVVGFWGGTTESDRTAERRRLGIVLEPESYERHLEIMANKQIKVDVLEWN